MHVITRKKLLSAAGVHPDAAIPLDVWCRIAKRAKWASFADLRKTWSSADIFQRCTVFNIKGNKYRLIAWIDYRTKRIFVRNVLTHADYSKEGWKNDCSG